MKRYKKIVLEADEGIFFDVSKKEEGKLLIKASHKIGQKAMEIEQINHIEVLDTKRFIEKYVYYLYEPGSRPNYMNPPIPNNYEYVKGTWNDGFVIRRKEDGSEFVWVPVGSLKANGTLDGKNFDQQFGRRNWYYNDFSKIGYYEPLTEDFLRQIISVEKHGGFWASRYDISQNKYTGNPQSIQGEYPWTGIEQKEAIKIAARMERSNIEVVSSHLLWGAEYDSVLEWFMGSGARTEQEIREKNNRGTKHLNKTGQDINWRANKIYDFSENVFKMTQERWKSDNSGVLRGCRDDETPASAHVWISGYRDYNGIRTALYIA